MLVLTRKLGGRICIGDSVILTVVQIQGGHVRLGFDAPPEVGIVREELLRAAGAPVAGPAGGPSGGRAAGPRRAGSSAAPAPGRS